MASITYDVRLWKMETYHGARVTTYRVRWTTDGKPWGQSFRSKAQAVSFEASLRSVASKGRLSTPRPGVPCRGPEPTGPSPGTTSASPMWI
jgi:hypothetical protein